MLRGGGDLQMVLCYSMNAGSVVGIPLGGEDTQILNYAKNCLNVLHPQVAGTKKLRVQALAPSHLMEFPLPNFTHSISLLLPNTPTLSLMKIMRLKRISYHFVKGMFGADHRNHLSGPIFELGFYYDTVRKSGYFWFFFGSRYDCSTS